MEPDPIQPLSASEHLAVFTELLTTMFANRDVEEADDVLLQHLELIETRVAALESVVARADAVALQETRAAIRKVWQERG